MPRAKRPQISLSAARGALKNADYCWDIDIIIIATTTLTIRFRQQRQSSAKLEHQAFAFDVQAVCAGLSTASVLANRLLNPIRSTGIHWQGGKFYQASELGRRDNVRFVW